MSVENYKNVIIGSGEGGKYLAWHLAQSGQQTVVVERRWVGGSCPNVNCLPSKNEIWSAKVADLMHPLTTLYGRANNRTVSFNDRFVFRLLAVDDVIDSVRTHHNH